MRFGDATLRVLRGRPDIPSELHAAAAEASGTVGVYVAGGCCPRAARPCRRMAVVVFHASWQVHSAAAHRLCFSTAAEMPGSKARVLSPLCRRPSSHDDVRTPDGQQAQLGGSTGG